MRTALIAVLAFAYPYMAQAQPPKWLVNTVCASAGVTAVTEIVLTEACLQQHTCREVNPIMPTGTTGGDALGRAAIKGVGGAAVIRLAYVPENRWIRLAVCGGYTAFNLRLTARGYGRLQ